MASRYKAIWDSIKKNHSEKKETVIKCNPKKAKTIIQGVKKEKSKENAPRVALELPSFGELVIRCEEAGTQMKIIFKLGNSWRPENL